jgi:hypothetical protein
LDARRPLNGRRDLLSFNGVARCNSSDRDTEGPIRRPERGVNGSR